MQVTAASVVGRYGRQAQSAARRLLELGLVHVLASEHGPTLQDPTTPASGPRLRSSTRSSPPT